MRFHITTILPCLVILSLLLGCASKYGAPQTKVNYYPQCYRPIHTLRAQEHDVAKATGGGALIGALGGALLGFLSRGDLEGAIVGGVAGAATGAVMGNLYAKNQQIADENKRMMVYLEEIEGDIHNLDIVSASATSTLQCYDREFALLLEAITNKAVTRLEAENRFREISQGRDEALKLLGQAITRGRDLDQQYEAALFKEERDLAKAKQAQPAKAKLNTVRHRKRNFTSKIDAMAKQQKEAEKNYTSAQRDFEERLEQIDI